VPPQSIEWGKAKAAGARKAGGFAVCGFGAGQKRACVA